MLRGLVKRAYATTSDFKGSLEGEACYFWIREINSPNSYKLEMFLIDIEAFLEIKVDGALVYAWDEPQNDWQHIPVNEDLWNYMNLNINKFINKQVDEIILS